MSNSSAMSNSYSLELSEETVVMNDESGAFVNSRRPTKISASADRLSDTDTEANASSVSGTLKNDDSSDADSNKIWKPTTPLSISDNQMKFLTKSIVAGASGSDESNLVQNKIVYVKIIPKKTAPTTAVTSKSISTSSSLNDSVSSDVPNVTNEPEPQSSKSNGASDNKEEQSTSKICEDNQPVEHTVNILNNNRILIKSVKNNHSVHAVKNSSAIKANEQKSQEKLLDGTQATNRNIDNINNTSENGRLAEKEVVAEKKAYNHEQLFDEESTCKNDDLQEDAQKIKRESVQLQKPVHQSQILSNNTTGNDKRGRRPNRSSKFKHSEQKSCAQANDKSHSLLYSDTENHHNTKSPVNIEQSVSRPESDVFYDNLSNNIEFLDKRNTRSRNVDFSAKQKKFLKGIQQLTRDSDNETDNSVVDDMDDDLSFCVNHETKIDNFPERRKSIFISKDSTLDFETRVSYTYKHHIIYMRHISWWQGIMGEDTFFGVHDKSL